MNYNYRTFSRAKPLCEFLNDAGILKENIVSLAWVKNEYVLIYIVI